ncbi:S-layer homology domain-containing protein [Paenibacillus thailandensis]|uniref:S-layer homology domain-containing protein n=1 Tax=Paenibacillus thailandensis TaxID=393250 RepID=A0ABW5R4F5_9BACL
MYKRNWFKSMAGLLVFAIFATVMAPQLYAAETNGTDAGAVSLSDIDSSYAKQEITALVNEGIISGFEDGTFKPAESMTRAQLAKVIVLAMGLEEDAETANIFTDVKEGVWYAGYVGALVKSGITQGTSATTFSPGNTVTREELAVFFIRAFGLSDMANSLTTGSGLTDFGQVSSWAKASVSLASGIGFIKGIEVADGSFKFNPKGKADRQGLARLTYEFFFNKSAYLDEAETLAASQKPDEETTTASKSQSHKKDDDDDDSDNDTPSVPDPSETEIINVAGEYSLGAVDGSLTIAVPDVTLVDTTISGDLVISEGVGQGDVYLNNVTVAGQTFVNGGGVNSIHIADSVLATVIVNKADGSIRLVLESGTNVQQISLQSGAVLETAADAGEIGAVEITSSLPQNASVTLNGTFDNVRVHAAQAQIVVPAGAAIGNLEVFAEALGTVFELDADASVAYAIVNAVVSFIGEGQIETAEINVEGATFENQPNNIAADPSVTDVAYTPRSVELSALEATYQIVATGLKGDAGYLNVTNLVSWSSSDVSVAEVTYGLVKANGEGVADITGVYGEYQFSVPVTVSVYEQPGIAVYPSVSGIEVANGKVEVEFAGDVEDESLSDFIVSASLDGEPVELDNLQYNSDTNTFTFDPVTEYGKTLFVTVEADANKTKFAGSQSGLLRLTGFGGTIVDVNGEPVSGLQIKFRKGLNNTQGEIVGTVETDEYGQYFIYLAPGIYTGELGGGDTGFVTTYLIGVAAVNEKNVSENQTAIRVPAGNETRIVLTWGQDPQDLDSHLIGPGEGEGEFHTWYGNKVYDTEEGVRVDLDLDDVTSYGPETTTIRVDRDGTYKFYVHHYSGSGTLKTSGAKIEVYRGAVVEPTEVYEVPTGSGDELYWIVFEMTVENGVATFTAINEFTNEDPATGPYVNDYYNEESSSEEEPAETIIE